VDRPFPNPCGAAFAQAVRNGGDPKLVVPDHYVVVRGGSDAVPQAGSVFSGATGFSDLQPNPVPRRLRIDGDLN
jgi:hypothetical protein